MEEEPARGLDWDSDETMVEGSVTESEREDEELPLKRLFFAQDSSFISDPSFHSGLRGIYGEASSPEIHLVCKLKEYLQEQMNKHMIKPLSEGGNETELSQALTQDEMDYSLFTEEGPQDDQVLDSENSYSAGFDAEDLGFLQRPEKELSDGDDSPEISLLSGAVITSYGTVKVKKKSSENMEGSSVLSESLKTVTLPSREIKGEDIPCEMLMPTIEDSSGFSESILGEYPFIVNEFETRELLKPLSDLGSPKSMSPLDHLLICQEDGLSEDMQENEKNDALPAELLTALNTLSESMVESICQRMERGSGPCAEDECLGTEPSISQTDDDCTQIAGMNFEFQHSVQPFGQGPKLTEPLFKDITMQQDKEDPNSSERETIAHQNIACFNGLSKEGDLNSMETNTVMENSYMLRRSARLKTVRAGATLKNIDEAYKMPEEILQKTDSTLPTEHFRTQDPAFQNNSDEKSVEWSKNQVLSAYSYDEQIRKSRRTEKNRKSRRNISKLSSINRRDIYGESPLHKAAQADDSVLVKKYIKLGGNVNLPDYAGWTALHEASVDGFYKTVLELLKGGADVNCKGMKQITPIYDAVLNGHYKVAELLLQNGADPLFKNDFGKCALDEASDPHMKQLLERYVHQPRRCPTEEQRNRSELSQPEETYQQKKPECSPRSTEYFNNENSRGIKEIEVSKRNKGDLLRNKGIANENHQKISRNQKLIPTRNKQSTVDQISAKEPPKTHMRDDHEPKKFVPMGERKTLSVPKRTEMSGRKDNSRIMVAASSKRITRSLAHQQQDPETFSNLSEKSGTLNNSVTLMLKNHNSEIFSASKLRGTSENDTTSLTLMTQEEASQSTGPADCQKGLDFLESEIVEPSEAIPLSRLPSCEEAKLPLATEGNDCTVHHKKPVPCETNDCSHPSQKSESVTDWEKCFLSFVDRNVDSDNDNNDDGDGGCISEGTVLPEKMTWFVNDENQSNCKANSEHEEKSSSQHYLLSETQSLLQENGFQAGSLTMISQQDINLSDSDCTVISERYIVNDGQNIKRTTSHVDPEQIPLASIRAMSVPDLSGQISGVEISSSLHHNNSTAPSSVVNQTDEERVTNLRGKESSERNCTEKTQEGHQNSTECIEQSCGNEAAKMVKKPLELPGSEATPNKNVQSTKNMNEDLRDASHLKKGIEKTNTSQSDKEMTDNVNREQSTERSHEEAKEKRSPDTHMPRNLQLCEKRVQIKRKRQDLQETTNSQDLSSRISTNKDLQNQSQQEDSPDPKTSTIPEFTAFGKEGTVLPDKPSCGAVTKVQKRNAKGKSRLHLAAKRGDLSLVKALIESGAYVNQKDNAGWTALHEAANKGFNEVMVELLKAGANVNSESLDGLLPIHNAVSGNHLKAAEILLQHGSEHNQKDGDQKSALDRADDEKMKKLLKSYSGNETGEICDTKVTEKLSSRSKRQKQHSCCKSKHAGPLSFSHQDSTRERTPMHESICTILQDIEEKQESLLLFEIRTPKDADQYSEKMLQIKDIMDSVLAKQKKERDDLAKKYRASVESFKHGALREQLANLATRQKSLLMVAQKQKKLSQKIQNYKNTRNRSGLSVRGESCDSRNSSENDEGSYPTPVERTTQPESVSVPVGSPASLMSGSGQKTHCATENGQEDSQNLDSCISERGVYKKLAESDCFSFNELISEGKPGDHRERISKSNYTHGIERVKLPPLPVISSAPTEYLQEGSYTSVITAKGSKSPNPSAITETLNVLETTSTTVKNNTHQPSMVCQLALTSCLLPGNMAKKTVSQDPPRAVSEFLVQSFITRQENVQVNSGALLRMKPNHTESRPVGAFSDNNQISFSSESANQNNKQEPLNYRAEMKMKKTQIKELISLGRIKPGNDVLEFKMQDATYKASILPNGKIKSKNGEIYKNPITWIKALLGSNISVTWKYVWNKVTYLGKELCKYITEEVPIVVEPNVVLQENQPCLPGPSSDSVQNFTHYLQLNEILLISNQELLPCHIMEQHWKFYMTSMDGPF
ncbi:ankyrin repeat domain-containing protein 31 [Dromiciops gliroides]|uniref:ankyrin repeat domain-containing protein 31 n=1 Tax=Dromiciops gliroides TaxID=33562 RepID=UPI001CC804A6|nr:ankyrin repeat domain-containing protein 31 [Dromiciops gliroides]